MNKSTPPSTELPLPSKQSSKAPKSFFRPFGRSSLVLAVGAFVLPWFLNSILTPALQRNKELGDVTSSITIGTYIAAVAAACSLGAVVFGLLSLIGYGKQNGKSHRFAGFFGVLIGGAMVFLWGSLFLVAINAASAAKHRAEAAKVAAQGSLQPFHDEETGAQLTKPAGDWVLFVGEQAKEFNKLAAAVLIKKATSTAPEKWGFLLMEPRGDLQSNEIDFSLVAEKLVETMQLEDRSIELLESTKFQGRDGAKYVVIGKPANSEPTRYSTYIFVEKDYLVRYTAVGPASGTTIDDPDIAEIHNALKLVPR